jgi:hypothetical protein
MTTKPAVLLLCGDPHSGKRWVAEYLSKARRDTGASVECISFRQAKIQSAIATLANASDILVEGVTFRTVTTFPLTETVQEFLKIVDVTARKESPSLFAHWVMAAIRLRFQDGCQFFIVPDLEYVSDIRVFLAFEKEFNFRFVHVVAANRTAAYLKSKKLPALEELPENVELARKEAREFPRITAEAFITEFPGLKVPVLDNSVDGPEQVKDFQVRIFFDMGLRVTPDFPWPLFLALVAALIGIYYNFYY